MPVSWKAVTIDETFWTPHLRVNREQTLPLIYRISQETGRFENFRQTGNQAWSRPRTSSGTRMLPSGLRRRATAWVLIPIQNWKRKLTKSSCIVAAQQPDGYLNTYFTAVEPEKRWTNLRDWHELYCAGHLIEAAVAHFQATGKRLCWR